HRAFGNVDLKLGLIMAIGTIAGAEAGAQLIQMLKRAGNVNFVVSIVSIVVYLSISAFMMWESRKTLKSQRRRSSTAKVKGLTAKKDKSAFSHVSRAIQRLKIWPMIALPTSGVKGISLWIILVIALVMHTGAAIGAQIGAISTQYFAGPKIRLAFVPLPLIGAAIVIYTLFTGHKL